MQNTSSQNERAVAFFQQSAFTRLLNLLRQKYIELGQVGGQIILSESSQEERRELASFLGRPPYTTSTIKIKLSAIDSALQKSGFHCTLPELLLASFPEQPLITRPQQRAARTDHQARFYQELTALHASLPDATQGKNWLQQGLHGLEWLFIRTKNMSLEEQSAQLKLIRSVAMALNQLPTADTPERLALFAQRVSGDPHHLDPQQPAGRLFLLALADLMGENIASPLQGREQELHLYKEAHLRVDTISSYVAVFNLSGATLQDTTPDPLLPAAGARTLLLPLSQLLQWQGITIPRSDVYILENPQVFEEIVDSLSLTKMPTSQSSGSRDPTLICTAGWPSLAALKLLDMLIRTNPNTQLYYSGDFDLKGLQIATYVLERYPAHCHLWHMDTQAYVLALQAGGVQARKQDLQIVTTLPDIFIPLIQQIQATGMWAYQEGIASHLTDELARILINEGTLEA